MNSRKKKGLANTSPSFYITLDLLAYTRRTKLYKIQINPP